MSKRKRRDWYPLIYGVLLTGFTAFILLDAFVLPGNIVSADSVVHNNIEETAQTEAVVTETSYQSDSVSIEITTLRQNETDIYVADVILTDPTKLRAGLADNVFGRNVKQTTSEIAEANNAILAINGDFYGFRTSGYVLRNGYLYRESVLSGDQDDLVISEDGSMSIISESEISAAELAANGAQQIYSFGPALIIDSEIAVNENSEVEQAMQSNPRTAIGMIDPLHYILLVSDGRTSQSEGLTLYQLAQVMQDLGCTVAYNLDGGGSSTMWFMGEVVNHPTTSGRSEGERSVSDIVYIAE